MERQIDLPSWEKLEEMVRQLQYEMATSRSQHPGFYSHLLFRGQGNSEWALETTLDRVDPGFSDLSRYYRIAAAAKTRIETFTNHSWPDIDFLEIDATCKSYDTISFKQVPHFEYLVYLRHHGFPSPLLDWSKSFYIAAYFAFLKPEGDRVAIYAFQEYAGSGKFGTSNQPQIISLGPYIRSHPRHFLQQGEYTMCLNFKDTYWNIGKHADVFELNQPAQDRLWKLTIPSSELQKVIQRLDQYNISAYSLFQTEEALMQTLSREFFG